MEKEKTNKKLLLRRLIVVIVLVLIVALIITGLIKFVANAISGNNEVANGNLNNRGLAIQDGNVTFYNKYEEGIYRVKGNREDKVTDETAYSMTLYNNQIYYLTVSSSNTIDLKRVDISGENLETIKTLYTSISKFYIDDGFVYYISNGSNAVELEKLDLNDNTEVTLVTSNIQDFVLEGKTIYYTDNVGYLYSINTDGTNQKEISKDYRIYKIQINKKWIYYFDEDEVALCRIKKDGSSREVVTKFVTGETYNVTDGEIYYFDSENKRISKTDFKGKKSVEIVSLEATGTKINVVGDTLYYLDKSKDGVTIYQMYRVKTNGKAAKEIQY